MVAVEGIGKGEKVSCSCLMIVRDAEKTIEACLRSVIRSGCFDRIVIVQDTRIQDPTRLILSDYAKIVRYPPITLSWHKWKGEDYSEARNRTLEYADTQYGYWIDADEVLMDAAGIRRILEYPAGAAYHIWQISPTPDRAIVKTHQLRLFPILTGVKWELPVHEQLAFSLRRLGIPEHMTRYRVWHLGYSSEEGNRSKHRRYAAIMKRWLAGHKTENRERGYIQEQYKSSSDYLRNFGQL